MENLEKLKLRNWAHRESEMKRDAEKDTLQYEKAGYIRSDGQEDFGVTGGNYYAGRIHSYLINRILDSANAAENGVPGKVTVAGTYEVNGELFTGFVVACKKEDVKEYAKNLLYENVKIIEG